MAPSDGGTPPTSVTVAVRVRPLNQRELDGNASACVHVMGTQSLTIRAPVGAAPSAFGSGYADAKSPGADWRRTCFGRSGSESGCYVRRREVVAVPSAVV